MRDTPLVPGLALVLLGIALSVSPLLPWYAVDLPARRVTAAGVEVSGELWLMPLLGVAIVVAGITLLAGPSPPTRAWAEAAAALAGVLAAGVALRSALTLPVELTVDDSGQTFVVGPEPTTEPLAYIAVLAAAGSVAIAVIARVARRRPRRERR
jgi:hypothetical protein